MASSMLDMPGGMDMGTNMFQSTNMALAADFWYMVAGVVAVAAVCYWAAQWQRWQRLRACDRAAVRYPTQPTSRAQQAWATATAIVREMSYPQTYVAVRGLRWATPPPAGRVLLLASFWAVIVYYMVWDAIVFDAYFWERIGFRNAWVTVMQLPLLYVLASKSGLVLGALAGISHERVNWLHRWVARTMFVTGAVHGWHFYTEWARADFVQTEFAMMPIVLYGIGAWAVLGLQFVVGFAPLRHLCYEVWLVQHIISAVVLLWLLYVHVPSYAVYNVWFAVAATSLDRLYRVGLLLWHNVKLQGVVARSRCRGGQRIGHQTLLKAVGRSTTVITIKDVHFRWRSGQYLYLWIPRIGVAEAHPYTIASAHRLSDVCVCNSIQLVVRKHAGFSRRIHDFAVQAGAAAYKNGVTAFVTGPFGVPPRWDMFETVVLISASTGASFTLPILEGIVRAEGRVCTTRVDFLLAAKRGEEISFYMHHLDELVALARQRGRIALSVTVATTSGDDDDDDDDGSKLDNPRRPTGATTASSISTSTNNIALQDGRSENDPQVDVEKLAAIPASAAPKPDGSNGSALIHRLTERPDIASFVRAPVEASGGETSVVVCGGKSLVAAVRNCVASLSDERAVHKGTGAQGIHLHVEEYCF